MPGSVRQRQPGVWELRVYVGRDAGGRVRHKHATFRGTKKAAERELARMVADVDRQPPVVVDSGERRWGPATTINHALAGWQANGWDDLSPSTIRRYQSIWDTHIRSSIGTRTLATLSPYDVERYFRELKAQGLAESSVRQVRAMLHRACRLARKWSGGSLPNPIADTELPVWTLADRTEVRAPTVDEVVALLQAAGEDVRFGVLLRLVAATGMRRGEVCALRWSDVDFGAATVRIDESIVAAEGGALVKAPKTRASIRTVAVDAVSISELQRLRSVQAKLAGDCGEALGEDAFVFSNEPGGQTPPYPDGISHTFTLVRDAAGIAADVHLHSLRHFHATALDPVISDAQKQARLGWSTVKMARHYTGVVPEEDRRAAEHIAGLLGGDPSAVRQIEQ